jgi:hypothetical protein
MANYIHIINYYGELYSEIEKNVSLAGGISTRQHKGLFLLAPNCWRVLCLPAKTAFNRHEQSLVPDPQLFNSNPQF